MDDASNLLDHVFEEFPGVSWSFTTDAAPVQAEGTIGETPFYFRSRWDRWRFSVASSHQPDPVMVDSSADGFYREAKYRTHRFSASYMPLDIAKKLIDGCIGEYLESQSRQ